MAFSIAEAYVSITTKGGRRTQSTLGAIANKARWMAGAMVAGGAAATSAMLGLAYAAAKAGDEIHKMAGRTGASTEFLSEMGFAAEQSGSDIAAVEKGISTLERNILDLGRGMSSSVDNFTDLGLTFQELQGLSVDEQFTLVADRLSQVEDASKRAALAQKLFGRSGRELGPLLNEGAQGIAALRGEAAQLGRTISQEEANQAAEFTDAMNRMQSALGSVARKIGAAILPVLTDVLDYAQWVVDNWDLLWQVAAESAGMQIDNVLAHMEALQTNAERIGEYIGASLAVNFRNLVQIAGAATKDAGNAMLSEFSGPLKTMIEMVIRAKGQMQGLGAEAVNAAVMASNIAIDTASGVPKESALGQLKLLKAELPEFVSAATQETTPFLEQLYTQLAQRAAEQQAKAAKEAGEAGVDALAESASQASRGASRFDARSLASTFQQAALNRQQQKQTDLLGDIAENTKKAAEKDNIAIAGP